MSETLIDDVKSTIEEAMSQWLPHVIVKELSVQPDEDEPNKLIIEIEFSLTIRPEVHESLTLDFLIGE